MPESILSRSEVATDLFCKDYDRCLTFYRDTLGLSVEELTDMPGNALVHVGKGQKILLHPSDSSGDSGHTALSFLVDDVDAAIEHLRSKGVKLEDYDNLPGGVKTVLGVAKFGGYSISWFKDPGGNILCVSPISIALRKAA